MRVFLFFLTGYGDRLAQKGEGSDRSDGRLFVSPAKGWRERQEQTRVACSLRLRRGIRSRIDRDHKRHVALMRVYA